MLYLIEILHQTTTERRRGLLDSVLYLIEILHQTTTVVLKHRDNIKLYLIEILHQTTTSEVGGKSLKELYLIEILHQTTTQVSHRFRHQSCILLKFYIKPQRNPIRPARLSVVSY